MTKGSAAKAAKENETEPTRQQLERQMQQTRESLAETVGEIKETVEHEYDSVRQTVSGVLDYREQFKEEPLIWSLGALSAGFALGYTVGYAHKNTKGGKQSQFVAFADGMVD
jgi:isocitrate lyase